MKVSILGNGLTSLALAKMLVNKGICVDIFSKKKTKKYDRIQTLGISKSNSDFFNKNIINIKKILWNIDKIEIYSENLFNEKILDFENDKYLFSVLKNFDLYNSLFSSLSKSKLINFKKEISYNNLIKNNYDLIFNCDYENLISKKFFYNKIDKDYNSLAYITTIIHKKLSDNHTASQIFTKRGPIAFLPISSTQTSVIISFRGKENIDLKSIIKKHNVKYKILKINKTLSFKLKSSNLRFYHYKNIIAFGDLLHKLHPLAGQGFNMTIRDIKEIDKLIKIKIENGLNLDNSICFDFEKNTKANNYLFSNGIDFIYEYFNIESRMKNNTLSKSVKFLGKNKFLNNLFKKFANNGLTI